jgi:hypothetical protein
MSTNVMMGGAGMAREQGPRDASEAQERLNRLLAEFRLYGGFGAADGMRRWGEIQRAVREAETQRGSA